MRTLICECNDRQKRAKRILEFLHKPCFSIEVPRNDKKGFLASMQIAMQCLSYCLGLVLNMQSVKDAVLFASIVPKQTIGPSQ